MGACSVPNCANRSEKGVKVYQCPRNPERRKIWLKYLREQGFAKNDEIISNIFHICEIHFVSSYTSSAKKPKDENPGVPKGTWHRKLLNVSK